MPLDRRAAAGALVLLALTACTTTRNVAVKVAPQVLPAPLFQPLPITVGVWYAPELARHRAQGTRTVTRPNGDSVVTQYDIDSADVHMVVLRRLMDAAFERAVELPAKPDGPVTDPAIGLQAAARVERIAYGGGADIRYLIELYRPGGEALTNIFVAGIADESLGEARWLEAAIRDAAAQVLVRLARSEEVAAIVAARRQGAAPIGGKSS